ncbi:MAG: efflux RND transporter periplasmic adaptor subunit [Hyphomicrobiales bacterium]
MICRSPRSMALLLAAGFVASCSEEPATKAPIVQPVKAVKVGDASAFQKRWFPGRAKATNEVELSFRVAGTIVALPIDVGDKVKKGDLIAGLDPATFKAQVARHRAGVERSEADHENARLQLERQVTLFKQGWRAKAAVDIHTAKEKTAAANIAASKAALEKASLDLSYTTLQAPFPGIVVSKYLENFQDVRAKQAVARLVDASKVEMVISIPENLISQSSQVRDIVVVFDAFPDIRVPAEIKEVGTEASETTRTFPVTLIMDQPKGAQILPGMAGKATAGRIVGLEEAGKTVTIPTSALLAAEGGKSAVWVVDEVSMTVSQRPVTTGTLDANGIRVTQGLKPGEWVVTAGVNSLDPGQKVSLLQKSLLQQ